jgi:uncharacterized protein (TIGR02246 family)
MTEKDAAIRALFERSYPEAVATANGPAYVALYTEDALRIRPGEEPRRGREAIAAGFKAMLDGLRISPTFVVDEIERHGSSATVLGHGESVVTDLTTFEQTVQHFQALWIVRQQRGQWLIHRQIWTPTP